MVKARRKLADTEVSVLRRELLENSLEAYETELAKEIANRGREFEQLASIELNLAVLEDPKPGDTLRTAGHHVALVSAAEDSKPTGSVYVGRVQSALSAKELELLNRASEEFIQGFENSEGSFQTPEVGASHSEGFKYIGCGGESNVYLYKDTGMIFKIPHNENERELARAEGDSEAKPKAFVAHLAEVYARIDRKALSEQLNAEYVETYFLSAQDSRGKSVGVIVQPYLSDDLYANYDPAQERDYGNLWDMGVSDVYAQNVKVNKKTKRLVLFDCFFDL